MIMTPDMPMGGKMHERESRNLKKLWTLSTKTLKTQMLLFCVEGNQ
jgi:hypothetical protein